MDGWLGHIEFVLLKVLTGCWANTVPIPPVSGGYESGKGWAVTVLRFYFYRKITLLVLFAVFLYFLPTAAFTTKFVTGSLVFVLDNWKKRGARDTIFQTLPHTQYRTRTNHFR